VSQFHSHHQHEIPESLRKQLEDYRVSLWKRKLVEAVAAGMVGLLLSFLILYGLDRIWPTPIWARIFILLGGIVLFAGFVPYWLHRWVWGHRSEDQLARLISKKYPGLGGRLLGVIELQNQNEEGDSHSPRLRAAAMEVVAAEAEKRALVEALPNPTHRRWAGLAISLGLGVVATFVFTPKASLNALKRWILPFSHVERYTFTQLKDAPSELAVPYGESFEVVLRLKKDSEKRPEVGSARYETQAQVEAKLVDGAYRFRFPGQQEMGEVAIRIGDLRHRLKISPLQRPSVVKTRAFVRYPDYLGQEPRGWELSSGELSLVEGSDVRFEMEMSRPVVSGNYGPAKFLTVQEEGAGISKLSGELKIDANKITTSSLQIGSVPFELPFSWRDEFELKGGEDFQLRVSAVKDMPSTAYTQGLPKQKAILPEESIEFDVLCEDDFGLKKVGIEWQSLVSGEGERPEVKGELILAEGKREELRILKTALFAPAAFGIEPQRLMLRAFSEDRFPERPRSYSEPISVYVMSREEHAELLKMQFDRAISELEDLTRRETNLLDENQRLESLNGEELATEANRKRLETQERAETESVERMKELTEKVEDVMKGAARNGEIDKDSLKKIAGALKPMQELSQTDLPSVQDELRESREPSNRDETTQEKLESAVIEQKEALQKMQDALAQASEARKRLEASTFVSRLKKAANEESAIVATMLESFSRKLLGKRESDLDPSDRRKLGASASQQALTAADVRWIQEDLGHYHARTGNEKFHAVMKEMRDSGIEKGLEDVRSKLMLHHSFTATEGAKNWADRLSQWAATLGKELDASGGGGGAGGAAGPSPEDEDFEFMLRVMKMIQKQQDLRSQTRVLEQRKRDENPAP